MANVDSSKDDSRYLGAYFVLAFAISWSIGIPLALAKNGLIPAILPLWTHYLVAYGPMLSALIVTGFGQGFPGLKEFGKRVIRLSCPKWWLVAFSPLILGYILIKILNGLTGSQISLSDLGAANYLSPSGGIAVLLLWIFTFGLGEEAGWRGFALPRLQKGRSALGATMILAFLWALWYLPQLFYYIDISMAIPWLIGLFAGSVMLTWLYNSTHGSIFMVSIWHACFKFVTASAASIDILSIMLIVIISVWGVVVIVRTKPKNLISM